MNFECLNSSKPSRLRLLYSIKQIQSNISHFLTLKAFKKSFKLVDSFKQIKKDQNILSKRSNDANLASLKSFKECTHLKFLTFHRFKLLKHIKESKRGQTILKLGEQIIQFLKLCCLI